MFHFCGLFFVIGKTSNNHWKKTFSAAARGSSNPTNKIAANTIQMHRTLRKTNTCKIRTYEFAYNNLNLAQEICTYVIDRVALAYKQLYNVL